MVGRVTSQTDPRPTAVLWDMDGTLVDTEPYWMAAEHALVEEAGGRWTDDLGYALVGRDLWDSAEFIRANSPVTLEPKDLIDALLARVVAAVREQGVPWRPGARELLVAVTEAGIPSALVTMSWTALVEPILEALPEGTFSVLATGDVVAKGKPDPEPYLHAARALALDPVTCLAFEDSPTGVTSSTAAGVPTVAVPHIVQIPSRPGAVTITSLADVGVADLGRLHAEATATF